MQWRKVAQVADLTPIVWWRRRGPSFPSRPDGGLFLPLLVRNIAPEAIFSFLAV